MPWHALHGVTNQDLRQPAPVREQQDPEQADAGDRTQGRGGEAAADPGVTDGA